MPIRPVFEPAEFQDLINRPQATIFYFFDENSGTGPGPEFQPLQNDDYPGAGQVEAFFVPIGACPIQRDVSRLPLTVLYKEGAELDVADVGDMEKFFELCARGASEN